MNATPSGVRSCGSGNAAAEAAERLDALRQQIRQIERGGRALDPARIGAGLPELDALLPDGGYLPGSLVEFVAGGVGDAALWLSLDQVARTVRHRGGAAVLVDPRGVLYAPALVGVGIDPGQMVVVRGGEHGLQEVRGAASGRAAGGVEDCWSGCEAGYWALEQALRCRGVAAVWGMVPTADARWLRRLQLAAEEGGTLGVFLRPASVLRYPTWSGIQWQVRPPADGDLSSSGPWRFRLRLVRARSGAGQEIRLAIDPRRGGLQLDPAAEATPSHRGPIAPPAAGNRRTKQDSSRRGAVA